MTGRRRFTTQMPRSLASEFSPPKTVELEIRVARLELALDDAKDKIDLMNKRMIALQAQFDHFMARLTAS